MKINSFWSKMKNSFCYEVYNATNMTTDRILKKLDAAYSFFQFPCVCNFIKQKALLTREWAPPHIEELREKRIQKFDQKKKCLKKAEQQLSLFLLNFASCFCNKPPHSHIILANW